MEILWRYYGDIMEILCLIHILSIPKIISKSNILVSFIYVIQIKQ